VLPDTKYIIQILSYRKTRKWLKIEGGLRSLGEKWYGTRLPDTKYIKSDAVYEKDRELSEL
jgi:hypothetical protein